MRLATAMHGTNAVFGPIIDGALSNVAGGQWGCLAEALGNGQRAALDIAVAVAERISVASLVLLPPVPNPRRILCVGLNYTEHAAESDQGRNVAPSEHPVIFTRFASSLVGHDAPIVRPLASTAFDYEGELAVVIGTTARAVSAANAASVIGGYSCFMDGTLRDYQRHTSQFIPGKNFEQSGSFGPWIVTPDEFDHGHATLTTRVNGEVLQHTSTSQLIHPIESLIAYCSTFTTLEPGDVIATGTPGGVGYARTPPRWLTPGDIVEVEISGIGILANGVVAEQTP